MIIALMLSGAAPAVATVNVYHPGGGTWVVGTSQGWVTKDVVSHYHHNTRYHSATLQFREFTVRKVKAPKVWANADATVVRWWQTYAYWGIA